MNDFLRLLDRPLAAVFLLVAMPYSAHSALIVYEGFDMGNTAGSLSGKAGATSFGFDAAAWGNFGTSGGGSANYETTGLTFGSGSTTLVAIGGNARLNSSGSNWTQISRGLNATVTGTVWGSFLTNRLVNSGSENDFLEVLVNQSSSGHDNNAEFVIIADEYQSALGGVRGKNNPIWPSYNSGTAINDGETYLVLFKATNLGGTSGSAELKNWILSSSQFDVLKLGGLTEIELDAAALGSASNQVLQRGSISYTPGGAYPRLTAADVLMLQLGQGIHAQYDELRLSNAVHGLAGGGLDEVTPTSIPEPATLVLLVVGFAFFLALKEKNRKSGGL